MKTAIFRVQLGRPKNALDWFIVVWMGLSLTGFNASCTTDSPPTLNKPADRQMSTVSAQDQVNQEDAEAAVDSSEDGNEDIDIGGYTEISKETTASTTTADKSEDSTSQTSTATSTTSLSPAKGTDAVDRHDGQIAFVSRLQPFILTVTSMVTGKTVTTKEFSFGKREKAPLTVPGLCVTGGKTCLVVTLNGGVTQTAGKTACAKAEVKGPTKVFINSDVDGAGAIGRCFNGADDLEDAFTITCPNSTEMVMGTCASGF